MKLKKIIIFVSALIIVLGNIYLYNYNEKTVPILGYHAILPSKFNDGGEMTINAEKFENQLKILKKLKYKSLTLDEYYCWQIGKCKKPHHAVLITFDDGYQNNYDYAFPLLKKYNMNAVVFYIGSYNNHAGFMSKEILEKSKKEFPNIEFASHTYEHHEKIAKDYDEINEDFHKMEEILKTKYFAYPHGSVKDYYIKALKDSNYKMAFTFGPNKEHRKSSRKDDQYLIPRLNISKEIPDWKFIARLIIL